MTELEDAVRKALRYDADRAVGESDIEGLLTPRRRRRSDGAVRVLAAAAVVAVIAGSALGISHHHSRPGHTISPPPATTSKIGGLMFTLPPGGRFVGVTFATGAVSQPLGWIINQSPKPECEQHGSSGTCHGPYISLSAGQYAVSFRTGSDMGDFRATTTIAGLPAAQGGPDGGCKDGFTTSIETSLDPAYPKSEPKGTLLVVNACFGSNNPELRRTIKAMITDAHR